MTRWGALAPLLLATTACAQIAHAPRLGAETEAPGHTRASGGLPGGRGPLLDHPQRVTRDLLAPIAEAGVPVTGHLPHTPAETPEDPAYASEAPSTGRSGMPRLQRWAITRGVPFTSEPHPHDWVEAVAYPNR